MKLIYQPKAQKQFKKLDTAIQRRIMRFTDELESLANPRSKGKALAGSLSGLWRYRVGDYRIVCEIRDDECIIYAIHIAHRKEVYGKST